MNNAAQMFSQAGDLPLSLPQILFCQIGARHNYAMPKALHAIGALARFHTDLCFLQRTLENHPWLASVVGAVGAGRRSISGLDRARVRTHAMTTIVPWLLPGLPQNTAFALEDWLLGRAPPRSEIASADAAIVMLGSGKTLARRAQQAGIPVFADIFVTPLVAEIERRLRGEWPGWEDERAGQNDGLPGMVADLAAASNVLLCPSQFVADGVRRMGVDTRTAIVPYASNLAYSGVCRPEPGRVLFVGSACLRKGIAWLALAAADIRAKYPHAQIVVAGGVSPAVRSRPETSALTFLGPLSASRVADEYARADMLVLPTLAEGSASVVYEAMAFGLPVVTTYEAGSVCRHRHDGLIVPSGDAGAIAEAVSELLEDRALRARLSANASTTARQFTFEHWARTVLNLVVAELAGR